MLCGSRVIGNLGGRAANKSFSSSSRMADNLRIGFVPGEHIIYLYLSTRLCRITASAHIHYQRRTFLDALAFC